MTYSCFKRYLLVFISMIPIALYSQLSYDKYWLYVTDTNNERIEVNVKETYIEDGIVHVWVRYIPMTDEDRLSEIEWHIDLAEKYHQSLDVKKWLRYGFTMRHIVYDLTSRKSAYLSSSFYSQSGGVIDEVEHDDYDWTRIRLETIDSVIFDFIKSSHKFSDNGKTTIVPFFGISEYRRKYPNSIWMDLITK